jgi:hypothetical protein
VFTSSSTEHIVNELDHPLVNKCFRGTILDHSHAPLQGALVEVRQRNGDGGIRNATVDEKGRFKLNLHRGTYVFKVTSNGFQSLMGFLYISTAPKACSVTELKLAPGS